MDSRPDKERGYSRRQVLKGAPLAIAGAIALGALSRRLLSSGDRRTRQASGLPEGSIFSPKRDSRDRS